MQWFNSTFDKEVAEVCDNSLKLLLQEVGIEVCIVRLILFKHYNVRIFLTYFNILE